MPTYNGVNDYYRRRFGCKVYKLALDGGFTCPNRDGTLDTRGCIFCLDGSGGFAERCCDPSQLDVALERAKRKVNAKLKEGKYIAYFQAYTSTYGDVERMERLYTVVLEREDIVGLSLGTRPDCLPPTVMDMLARLNRIKPVSVELGLQTVHADTVRYIRRGYENACYVAAAEALHTAGIEVVTHIILGLPGETEQMMLQTVEFARRYSDGIKLQLLHVLKGTELEADYNAGRFDVMTMDEYVSLVKKCIAIIPPRVVVHRITGDGDKKSLVAPLWSADKKRVLNAVNKAIAVE